MRNFCFLLFFLTICNNSFCEEKIDVVLEQEELAISQSNTEPEIDPELKGLQWNRYVNKNFVILSIDDRQGRKLSNNILDISSSFFSDWNLDNEELFNECRIFCVPNDNLLKKLFDVESSKVEIRKNEEGETDINVIWVSLNNNNEEVLSPYLTRVIFFNSKLNLPWFFIRSAEILNSTKEEKNLILNSIVLFYEKEHFSCSDLFSVSFSDYSSFSKEDKLKFDSQIVVMVLMLKKELGSLKLSSFLKSKNKLDDKLSKIYGYDGLKEFQVKYDMYFHDIAEDAKNNKVPLIYLEP